MEWVVVSDSYAEPQLFLFSCFRLLDERLDKRRDKNQRYRAKPDALFHSWCLSGDGSVNHSYESNAQNGGKAEG